MKKSGVYKIENKVNGKVYIGCSIDIEGRWKRHIWESKSKKSHCYNTSIHRAMRKYGLDNFDFSVLEETEDTYNREKYWIDEFDSYNKGYNETKGGDHGPMLFGEDNGRTLMATEDIISIRTRLMNGEMISDVYKDYEELISFRGFEHIWQGDSWINIMPEAVAYVKSEEYISKVRSYAASSKNSEIRELIKAEKNKGRSRLEVYEEFKDKYSLSGFNKVWYKK